MDEGTSFWQLFWMSFRARMFWLKEYLIYFVKYYPKFWFARLDFDLIFSYFWKSPYRIAKELSLEPYGETPFTTLEKICKAAAVTKNDRMYELGCGRGRSVFWLAAFTQAQVIGIELLPIFVKRAKALQEKFKISNCKFVCEDLFRSDLKDATVVYFYNPALGDADLKILAEKLAKELKKGSRIVSISFPITDYTLDTRLKTVKEFDVKFPWGKTSAYLTQVIA